MSFKGQKIVRADFGFHVLETRLLDASMPEDQQPEIGFKSYDAEINRADQRLDPPACRVLSHTAKKKKRSPKRKID
jgi:hypothetical protein